MIDNNSLWDVVKTLISWLWIPAGAYMSYKVNTWNKRQEHSERMEARLTEVEQQTKINVMQILDIRDDIRETKENIKEVKQGVDRLVDKLLK